ncbi:unnamed protein product [Urochloa decumbens]|uniref:DUF1618 domain-containing protein n=1 Tax=Urochloa decumbens TaxID=240449 RepID=A0ABC9ASV4_9POAL
MKLLTRLALSGFNGLRIFGCTSSASLRSIHLVPRRGFNAAAASNDPSWVILNCNDTRRNDSLSSDAEGNKAVAECHTTTGRRLRVSLGLVAPPASSSLFYHCDDTPPEVKDDLQVIAAHGDSVLLSMLRGFSISYGATYDHFLYMAGGAIRPPSLSLLPTGCILSRYSQDDAHFRPLLHKDTGILWRGDGELLVAQLDVMSRFGGQLGMANLGVLHFGRNQWELKSLVPIVHNKGRKGDEVLSCWHGDMAIPAGDRFLCWYQQQRGFILCDMLALEASPKLRYEPLPSVPYSPKYHTDDLLPLRHNEGMGVAGPEAVRLVSIEPRCCCGRFGRSSCARSRSAFTVTTWTMDLSMDEPMTWVKEGVLDCEELWAMPGYDGIPRKPVEHPVVSLDNPDVVCFMVSDCRNHGNKVWMIEVDTRRKALLSAVQCTTDLSKPRVHLPAKLQ